jgi:hypothetical protein
MCCLGKTWETDCERSAETSVLLACSGSEGSKAPMSELNFLYSRTSLEMTFSSRSGVIGIPLSLTALPIVWYPRRVRRGPRSKLVQ